MSKPDCACGPTVRQGCLVTRSAAETRLLASSIARLVAPGWVLLLDGPLGAGKTVFAQGLIAGLGYRGRVASPTFTLINEYRLPLTVWHADLYRLGDPAEFAAIGGEELLEEPTGLTLVEWAEKLGPQACPGALCIRISFASADGQDDRRRLSLSASDRRYDPVFDLVAHWHGDDAARGAAPATPPAWEDVRRG